MNTDVVHDDPASVPAGTPADTGLSFNPDQLFGLYREHRYEALADELLRLLTAFAGQVFTTLDANTSHFVNVLCKQFLYLFTQPDFVVDAARMRRFVILNPAIANLVAMSAFRTTDPWLELLLKQQNNLPKVLALYNPYCSTRIPRVALFDTDAEAASRWYMSVWQNYYTAPADERGFAWLGEHAADVDQRLNPIIALTTYPYFGATYVAPDHDHRVKQAINTGLQAWVSLHATIDNRPDPRKIAVLTGKWWDNHPVYRCMRGFLERLARDHELTLFHLGPIETPPDGSLFAGGVHHYQSNVSATDFSLFTPNSFGLALFPDIGMTTESVVLSNLRIAPIQVCGYGHPVSTRGALIDYWLGGRAVESIADAEANYSERLVLIAGAGVAPLRPDYTPRDIEPPADRIVIGCPWIAFKINPPLLALLERVMARAVGRVQFRMLPAIARHANGLLAFRRTLADRLGADNVIIDDQLPYADYMQVLEGCHFCLDSWPFGGYATVTDGLWLHKPVLSIEGHKFYNRAGAHLLRSVGLDELVVHSTDAFVDTAVRLVDDSAWRESLAARLRATDLEQALFGLDHADAFCHAIDYLLDNHPRLAAEGNRDPIVIDADDNPPRPAPSR